MTRQRARNPSPYARRLIQVAARRLPLGHERYWHVREPWGLKEIVCVADIERAAADHLVHLVALARADQVPWSAIGEALGVKPQSAYSRFNKAIAWTNDDMKALIDTPIAQRAERKAEASIDQMETEVTGKPMWRIMQERKSHD